MKGYIYILQKKDRNNTNVFKIGRTNDLQRRLNQYNKKNEMPMEMQQLEGDVEKQFMVVGSAEHLEWMETMVGETKSNHQKMIDGGKVHKMLLVSNITPEYEYVFTQKVNDCKWVEKELLDEMYRWDDSYRSDMGWRSEWFHIWDGWFDEMKEMIERFAEIDKERNQWMDNATVNWALWGVHQWEMRTERIQQRKLNRIHTKLDTPNKINSAKKTSNKEKTIRVSK